MNRKVWSSEEKIAVALEILRGKDSMAAILTRHGISATQAYKWRDQFIESGRQGLKDKRTKNGRDPILTENRRLKELVGSQALVIEAQKKLEGLLNQE